MAENNVNCNECEKAPEEKKQKKVSKTSKEIEALREELSAQKETFLRTAAEFDNFKKRTEREKASTIEFTKAQTVKPLLTVLDNFDRALLTETADSDFKKGIEMIAKQLSSALSSIGLEEIAAEGCEFDPQFHQAVMHIEDENVGENVITTVMQKGYKIGDTVIRPAMVQVAN